MDDEGRRCYEDFKILLTEERKKVAKLEGWLLYIYYNAYSLFEETETSKEISDYIKAWKKTKEDVWNMYMA